MALPTKPMTPAPVRPTVAPAPAPVMTPAMQRQQENQTFINQLNARDGKQRLVDPAAMKAAVDKNMAIKQATDARLKAEAAANRMPSKLSATTQNLMDRSSTINTPRDAMNFGRPVTKAKGGKVKSASARADGIAIRGKTRA